MKQYLAVFFEFQTDEINKNCYHSSTLLFYILDGTTHDPISKFTISRRFVEDQVMVQTIKLNSDWDVDGLLNPDFSNDLLPIMVI